MSKEIPIDVLSSMLRYCPESGKLFWLTRTIETFPSGKLISERRCAQWNAAHAGQEAFIGVGSHGYRRSRISPYGGFLAHRVAWALFHREWPALEIDHINGDRLDNRIVNLRAATSRQNKLNRSIRNDNSHGVAGLLLHSRGKKRWQARISVDGRVKSLGYFATKEEAIASRQSAESDLGYVMR